MIILWLFENETSSHKRSIRREKNWRHIAPTCERDIQFATQPTRVLWALMYVKYREKLSNYEAQEALENVLLYLYKRVVIKRMCGFRLWSSCGSTYRSTKTKKPMSIEVNISQKKKVNLLWKYKVCSSRNFVLIA